ncbi:MAG: hypothetical protein ABFD97_05160, partial [Syntrophobacter sp.]
MFALQYQFALAKEPHSPGNLDKKTKKRLALSELSIAVAPPSTANKINWPLEGQGVPTPTNRHRLPLFSDHCKRVGEGPGYFAG